MSSSEEMKLLIVTIDKQTPQITRKKLNSEIKDVEDIYLKSIENKWIKSHQMFFFINKGKLLKSNTYLKDINSDIILITCSKLTDFRLSSVINNNSLMQDISNIIMRPSLSSGSILPYLNTNLTSLSGNDTSSIPVVPFNTTSSENLAPAFLSSANSQLAYESVNSASGSQLMQEFQTTINNMLNSVNTSVLDTTNTSETSNTTILDPSLDNTTNSNTVTNTNTETVDNTTSVDTTSVDTPSLEQATITIQQPPVDLLNNVTQSNTSEGNHEQDEVEINEEGTNAESVTSTLTQLLNIYSSGSNSLNLASIREQYSAQFSEMRDMGFTDHNKILMSLYVCEGNCENAINYYLSLQDD